MRHLPLSDLWSGPAVDLAELGQVAVFPAMGWWRHRPATGRHARSVRYALLVSIEAPDVEVDLYAAVQTQIAARVQTAVEVATG
jgi:hypothetical protein